MKKLGFPALLAAGVLSLSLAYTLALAQQGMPTSIRPAAAGPNTALLDVNYVFKNNIRFKAMMDAMKADVERAEATVKNDSAANNKLRERLQQFSIGTPDYKALEQDIAKRQADLAVQIQLQKNEFLRREAKIYHTIYQEILQEVDYYCASSGVDMVLRFNGDVASPENPEEVLRDINKPVVWYAKNRDITPVILERLNKRVEAGPIGGRPLPLGVPFNR